MRKNRLLQKGFTENDMKMKNFEEVSCIGKRLHHIGDEKLRQCVLGVMSNQ